ncbi:MAG: SDR family oxidoreductase [Bacteroidetes bacterium]|nr:SDR family oxidoreductase [Bacteroidota bacterium]
MKNKIIVITGASSGIGKSCAEVFAKAGSKLVIAARNAESLALVENELKKITEVISVVADVSKEEDCRKLVEATVNRFGCIDVMICNAGISMRALFEQADLSVLKKLMDTNFWGTVYCTKHALPHLLRSKGSVVGISSIAGKKGLPGRSGYSASKFAIEGFLESLRVENLKKDLHVLVACPGFTASGIRESSLTSDGSKQATSPRDEKKMMTPEVVAEHVYKAVVKRKRDLILTVNGRLTVWLDKFFPSLLDSMVFNHLAKEKDSPFHK